MVIKPNTYMKKIALNESGLLKIVNKVINEQDERQFNEDEIDIINFIFEREMKPPFREGEDDYDGDYPYYNRDNEIIGSLYYEGIFSINNQKLTDIKHKLGQVLNVSINTDDWWIIFSDYLKSWIGAQINRKLTNILID